MEKTNMAQLPLPLERNILLYGEVDENLLSNIAFEIIRINENDQFLTNLYLIYGLDYNPKPIKLLINTFGGELYPTFGLVGVMEASKTPIHTYCIGSAMSSGFLIFISGHKRYTYNHITLMYHQLSSTLDGEAKKIEQDLEENKRLMEISETIVTTKTKITRRKLKQIYDNKDDWYIAPTEAKKLGIVDEILTAESPTEE